MFSKVARVITVVPVTALITLVLLYQFVPDLFSSSSGVFLIGFLLCIFPLLAYPMQPILPKFSQKGRKGQRTLAFIFAVIGYILALICSLFFHLDFVLRQLVLIYCYSALLLVIFNFGFHVRASAHASGVTCSALILLHYLDKSYALIFLSAAAMVLVWYSSLTMHRHKWYELLLGSALPIVAFQFIA